MKSDYEKAIDSFIEPAYRKAERVMEKTGLRPTSQKYEDMLNLLYHKNMNIAAYNAGLRPWE